jgi:hypothetical protein
MNARPGTQTMAHARASRSGPAGNAFLRVLADVPLAAQLAPIVGAFVCSQLLYARIAGHPHGLDLGILGGLATFFLLFVVLRFVDDLDDLERDHPLEVHGKAERSALRGRLVTCLAATVTGIVLLNVDDPHALAAALGACGLALAAPFGFKRLFPRSLAAGSLVFEGAPLAIFGYGYFFWRDAGGPQLFPAAAACVVILFWAGYEFWKFSRKVHSTAVQPYFLSPRGIRRALNAFLAVALLANLALLGFAPFSLAYSICATALPLAWLAWMNASWTAAGARSGGMRRPLWAGMAFVAAMEAGLLAELALVPRID